MWTISQLKGRAKSVFHQSYWRSVLAALLLSIAAGGTTISSHFRRADLPSFFPNFHAEFNNNGTAHGFGWENNYGHSFWDGFQSVFHSMNGTWAILFGIFGIIVLVAIMFGLMIRIFVLAPLEVGAERFFVVNRYTQGDTTDLSNIVHPFTHGYLQVVKTMFLKELYIFFWSLLFIIPGIVKSYSYRMVPYIMAENPEMESREAFRLSRLMMDGEKWDAFVLDLSFIGWHILSAFTLGVLGLFYVRPYQATTNTELYATLKEKVVPSNQYYEEQQTQNTASNSAQSETTNTDSAN